MPAAGVSRTHFRRQAGWGAYLGDDLVVAQRRRERTGEELEGGDRTSAAGAFDYDGSVEGEHGRPVVGGWVRVGETAADGATVADLDVPDGICRFGQGAMGAFHVFGARDDCMGGERPNRQLFPVALDIAEVG
jgi:hypothetical protein